MNDSSATERGASPADSTAGDAYISILFDGPPSHESGRFVEVNDPSGASINAGEWRDYGDGLHELRIENVVRWRQIETAPKDGRQIMISGGTVVTGPYGQEYPFDGPAFAYWEKLDGGWRSGDKPHGYEDWDEFLPTHWAPMPTPAVTPAVSDGQSIADETNKENT